MRKLTAEAPSYLAIVLERFPSLDDFTEREVCGTLQIVARSTATLIDINRLRELVESGVPPEAAAPLATRPNTALGAHVIPPPDLSRTTSARCSRYKGRSC